jgi:hypothetical protein
MSGDELMFSGASTLIALAGIIAGGLLLIAGVVVGFAASAMVALARASRRWPSTSGHVVRSEILERQPLIRYQYQVQGEEFEGRDIAAGDWPFRTARSAARRVQRYPAGAQVTVYYDDRDPGVAMLAPGLSRDVLYLPVVATVLMVIALVLLSWSIWQLAVPEGQTFYR